jgi:hypothetical protein
MNDESSCAGAWSKCRLQKVSIRSHLQFPTGVHALLFINQKELVRDDFICKHTQTAKSKCR